MGIEAEVDVGGTAEGGSLTEAPADSGADASSAPESDAQPTEAAAPAEPEYDWEKWDGEVDNLPEEARFWAKGVHGHVTKSFEQQLADAERNKQITDNILGGLGDPRVKELEKALEEGKLTAKETEELLTAKQAEYEQLTQAYDVLIEDQAKQEVEAFRAKYGDSLKDKATEKRFNALLEDPAFAEAPLDVLGQLVTLDENGVTAVREILSKEKTSVNFALEYVKATQTKPEPKPAPPPAPKPAKQLVAGSTKKARPGAVTGANKQSRGNLEERKLRVAGKFFR